ncbi:MAG: phytanoyl-CoA dioxygenase family protein [Chitinophagaceae bacterium]|nr:phytanoyl-CoA dioxygenase family protein [Anaerolineae bacterium]
MHTAIDQNIHIPYEVSEEQLEFFRTNGFIKLKQVLSAETIQHFGEEITRLTLQLNTQDLPLEERSTYGKAFLQVMNLWEHSAIVREFVMSQRLGKLAADLLQVSGVRLYHDQSLYKEPGGGITPWHADQYYWPLATDRTLTAWIPLQKTPVDMGALSFCAKSQAVEFGRDLIISDESERQIQENLQSQNFEIVEEPFDLGEVSFHLGWTFHRAGPNTSTNPRSVMTVIYMDQDMRLKEPTNANQKHDWETWCPGAEIGQVIDTPKNFVIYTR